MSASPEQQQPLGLIRGTLVHTHTGPVPIELLRPGHLVLSRSPDPRRRAEPPVPARIAAVRVHEKTPVIRIDYERPGNPGRFSHVTLAPGQPLLTPDRGWIRADDVLADWAAPTQLLTASGAAVTCVGKSPIRSTDYKDMGWIQLDAIDGEGLLWDFRLDMLIEGGRMYDGMAWGGERYGRCGLPDEFRTTTHSIEFGDDLAFFVEPHGVTAGSRHVFTR